MITIQKSAFKPVLGLGLLLALAGPAASELRPPIASGNYYEQNGSSVCSNGNACDIIFSPKPSDRRLVIKRVSCSVKTRKTPLASTALCVRRSASQAFDRSAVLESSTVSEVAGPVFNYAINDEAHFPIGGGVAPVIRAFQTIAVAGNEIALACQISGELLPQ